MLKRKLFFLLFLFLFQHFIYFNLFATSGMIILRGSTDLTNGESDDPYYGTWARV